MLDKVEGSTEEVLFSEGAAVVSVAFESSEEMSDVVCSEGDGGCVEVSF